MFIPNFNRVYGSYALYYVVPDSMRSHRSTWAMTRSRIKAIDQSSQRCVDKRDFDTSACIARHIEEELGCNPRIHGSSPSTPSRPCNSSTQLRHLTRISDELSSMNAQKIFETTGCMASCEKDIYEVANDIADNLGTLDIENQYFNFAICFENGKFEEREQYLIYDGDSFIADVGGFLGLLLGWSMYSLYQDMTTIVGKMKKKIMPKSGKSFLKTMT